MKKLGLGILIGVVVLVIGGIVIAQGIERKSAIVLPSRIEVEVPDQAIGNSPVLEPAISGGFVSDEIIVKFQGDTQPFRVLKVPEGKVGEKIKEFKKRADVIYTEPNYIAYALMTPNDKYYCYQWHLDDSCYFVKDDSAPTIGQNPACQGGTNGCGINVEPAWDISTGTGVTVAVVDTGIRKGTDLASTCFVSGYDFVNSDADPIDDNGHGTHVAGTVAQSTNNKDAAGNYVGVAGIAFNTSLMPVKVLNSRGSGTYDQVASGIYFAVKGPDGVLNTGDEAKVINLSLGGTSDSATIKDAVAYAYQNGVTVVAACGNENTATCLYPAAYDDYVIAVGATQYDETKAPYSNYGPSLDLVAPGGNTSLDQNKDGYADGVLQQTFTITGKTISWAYYFFQGTSMAAPHVSGVAALLIAKGNATTPGDVRAALQETAECLGGTCPNNTYGWGLVDAAAALTYVPPPTDNPPTISITNPFDGATVSGLVNIEVSATDDVGVVRVNFYVGATLIDADTVSPYSVSWDSTIVADGTYTLTATAIDTASQTASDSITVNVDNYNNPPVANAGLDQTVSDADGTGSETVTLDGSASYDPDGAIVSYEWTEVATLLGTTAQITYDFTVGTHTITLTVTDNDGATGTDTAIVTVSEKPAQVLCWAGSNQYLYGNSGQASKFCKCAQGIYGYNRYTSKTLKSATTVYQYVNTGENENWEVSSRGSRLPVYQVTCTDDVVYPTNKAYSYPK